MAWLADNVLDQGLNYLDTNGEDLHLCSQEPATYIEATSTYTLGDEQAIVISVPGDRVGGGREVTISAITAGDITGTGTVTHYAIVKVTATSELLVTGALSSSQAVTSGNTFDAAAFDVGIPDPA